jgi:hypothetical protein
MLTVWRRHTVTADATVPFGFLTDQMLRRGVHQSVQALEADIRAWVADWNQHPRPFIWTKTAEEILESLARYCRRISGAGH